MKYEKKIYQAPELYTTLLCAESFVCGSPNGGVEPSEEEGDNNTWPPMN